MNGETAKNLPTANANTKLAALEAELTVKHIALDGGLEEVGELTRKLNKLEEILNKKTSDVIMAFKVK